MIINDPRITIATDKDEVTIELSDGINEFIEVRLTPSQFTQALSRLMCTECVSIDLYNTERINKKRISKPIEFKVSSRIQYRGNRFLKLLTEYRAKKACPKGWDIDLYFGSNNSYFYKGKETWAYTQIYKYI